MAYAYFTEPINGHSDVTVIRDAKDRVGIRTKTPLTDEQMRDLYWIVSWMMRTGKTMKDLMKDGETNG